MSKYFAIILYLVLIITAIYIYENTSDESISTSQTVLASALLLWLIF